MLIFRWILFNITTNTGPLEEEVEKFDIVLSEVLVDNGLSSFRLRDPNL